MLRASILQDIRQDSPMDRRRGTGPDDNIGGSSLRESPDTHRGESRRGICGWPDTFRQRQSILIQALSCNDPDTRRFPHHLPGRPLRSCGEGRSPRSSGRQRMRSGCRHSRFIQKICRRSQDSVTACRENRHSLHEAGQSPDIRPQLCRRQRKLEHVPYR